MSDTLRVAFVAAVAPLLYGLFVRLPARLIEAGIRRWRSRHHEQSLDCPNASFDRLRLPAPSHKSLREL